MRLGDDLDGDEFEDEDPFRFLQARDGDHLICPFQCDFCHFVNVQKRMPLPENRTDEWFLACIRRANLDSLWARERSTVDSNRRNCTKVIVIAASLGLNDRGFPQRTPFPVEDTFGMATACILLVRSLDKGKNATTIQFETMRKLRAAMSNFWHSTPQGIGQITLAGDKGLEFVTNSPTNSVWFKRFMEGCHRRMGDTWFPDRAITIDQLLSALTILDDDWKIWIGDTSKLLDVALLGAALVIGFGGALRGDKLSKIDLGTTRKRFLEGIQDRSCPHVPVALAGRFKRETGIKHYILPLALSSESNIPYRLWTERILATYQVLGITSGPMFWVQSKKSQSAKITKAKVKDMDPSFHDILLRVQMRYKHVLHSDVAIAEEFSLSCSLRRGATTQARIKQVPEEVVSANNRWRREESSRGRTPSWTMFERYSDVQANATILTQFSKAL